MSDRSEDNLKNEIRVTVSNIIGPIAKPDLIQIVPGITKNTLRKNHAQDIEENRQWRKGQLWRYLHAPGSGCGGKNHSGCGFSQLASLDLAYQGKAWAPI
jgi:hypothetical protein